MSIEKTEAIVLNKYDFRETSLIVNFYTRHFGKISGLLKGIRGQPEKFASTLEPFSLNDIIFYRKTNSALHLVTQSETKDNFDGIRINMVKSGLTSVILELLQAVCLDDDANEDIFNLSLSCLKELASNCDAEKIIRVFKIKLLKLCGFKPHFDSCVSCDGRLTGQSKFSVTLGGLLCSACFVKDPRSHTIFRGTVATILHIEKNDLKNNLNLGLNPQIKRELDSILGSFLNFHLGKKLKSEEVVRRLK